MKLESEGIVLCAKHYLESYPTWTPAEALGVSISEYDSWGFFSDNNLYNFEHPKYKELLTLVSSTTQ